MLTNATGEALQREQEEGRRYNEVWAHFPDFPSPSNKTGDRRAGIAPIIAASILQADSFKFKWMLYGDVRTRCCCRCCHRSHLQ